MHSIRPTIALLILLQGCSGVDPSMESPALTPGEYKLVLKATTGRQAGRVTAGRLHLETATNGPREEIILWGWTDLDPAVVGAPVIDGSVPPLSRDPQEPGVAVTGAGARSSLWIGSFMNESDVIEDGGGIVLLGERFNSRGLRGRWEAVGIARAGRGTFVLTPLQEQ